MSPNIGSLHSRYYSIICMHIQYHIFNMHRISEHTVGILAILEPQIELAKNYKLLQK